MTMKLGTALVAALTLPFTFLFARVCSGAPVWPCWPRRCWRRTRWLWQVGRVGLRFPFPPAFGAAIFFFLVKALRDRRRNDFLLWGSSSGPPSTATPPCASPPWPSSPASAIALLAVDVAARGRPAGAGAAGPARGQRPPLR